MTTRSRNTLEAGMTDMFYVLYSPGRKQYVDNNGEFGSYEAAEKHRSPWFTPAYSDVKWVGPCNEGEMP